MAKKALVRKGDIGYDIRTVGVIKRVKFHETTTADPKYPHPTVWFTTGKKNDYGNDIWGNGIYGKTIFTSLEEANAKARDKLAGAINTARARIEKLESISNNPLPLVGFEKKAG